MKKKSVFKIIIVILSVALLMGLTACGPIKMSTEQQEEQMQEELNRLRDIINKMQTGKWAKNINSTGFSIDDERVVYNIDMNNYKEHLYLYVPYPIMLLRNDGIIISEDTFNAEKTQKKYKGNYEQFLQESSEGLPIMVMTKKGFKLTMYYTSPFDKEVSATKTLLTGKIIKLDAEEFEEINNTAIKNDTKLSEGEGQQYTTKDEETTYKYLLVKHKDRCRCYIYFPDGEKGFQLTGDADVMLNLIKAARFGYAKQQ